MTTNIKATSFRTNYILIGSCVSVLIKANLENLEHNLFCKQNALEYYTEGISKFIEIMEGYQYHNRYRILKRKIKHFYKALMIEAEKKG